MTDQMLGDSEDDSSENHHDIFPLSPWTLILQAKDGDLAALNKLLIKYEKPLYVKAIRLGCSHHEAEEMVWNFFQKIADPDRSPLKSVSGKEAGKMRAFLSRCFTNYFRDAIRERNTQKRGGGALHIPIDDPIVELVLSHENLSPDESLDFTWATKLMECAKTRYFEEFSDTPELARQIYGRHATGITNEKLAVQLNFTLKVLRTRLKKMRTRFESLLREEVSATLRDKSMIDEELQALRAAIQLPSERGQTDEPHD